MDKNIFAKIEEDLRISGFELKKSNDFFRPNGRLSETKLLPLPREKLMAKNGEFSSDGMK